jgi:D-glycero-alpha-D-manno-heptose-7-phosphate kinase
MRVCDNGGWSDTWFAGHGKVFSIAVSPLAEVQMRVYRNDGRQDRITIHAESYGERYSIAEPHGLYTKHPLLEAAIERMGVPRDLRIEVNIFSDAPAGCSTGTSAAVSVALLGALDRLQGGRMTPSEAAMAAHDVETRLLHQQCGIQDQIAAAYGGINLIHMDRYPHAEVERLDLPDDLRWELEGRLVLVYLGLSHNSSHVHRMVIDRLERSGEVSSSLLEPLRRCALDARDALLSADLERLGQTLVANTEAQRALHPELIGPRHVKVIEIAKAFHASGWKVNGAGGTGGSVAILSHPDRAVRREMTQAILAANPEFRALPLHLQPHGLRVWETAG